MVAELRERLQRLLLRSDCYDKQSIGGVISATDLIEEQVIVAEKVTSQSQIMNTLIKAVTLDCDRFYCCTLHKSMACEAYKRFVAKVLSQYCLLLQDLALLLSLRWYSTAWWGMADGNSKSCDWSLLLAITILNCYEYGYCTLHQLVSAVPCDRVRIVRRFRWPFHRELMNFMSCPALDIRFQCHGIILNICTGW